MPEDVIELPDGRRLVWWGSDCTSCGNTTPATMRCDQCRSDRLTVALFAEDRDG